MNINDNDNDNELRNTEFQPQMTDQCDEMSIWVRQIYIYIIIYLHDINLF